nr:unnamed protein product [Callosobruchus chinensis]
MGRKLPQFIAATCVCIGALGTGTVLGWTSNITDDLKAGKLNDLEMDDDQLGWAGSAMTLGAMVMCFPIGWIADAIGRKITVLLTVIPFTIGWMLIILAKHEAMIYIGRVLTGVAGGSFCVCAPLYTAEISETELRGTLGTFFQLFITIGILYTNVFGYFLGMTVYNVACAAVPIVFAALFFFQPETPVYYLRKGHTDKAEKSMRKLRGKDYDFSAEFKDIQAEIEKEKTMAKFSDAIKTKAAKKATLICFMLMFYQQLSGINAVVFYTKQIFEDAGASLAPHWCTMIIGVVQVVATVFAAWSMDKLGRKMLLCISCGVMGLSCILLGLFFSLKNHEVLDEDGIKSIGFLPILAMILFIVGFSVGLGPIPWLASSEIFPPENAHWHPSRAVQLFNTSRLRMPLCAITGAKYMTETGWTELRNPLDNDVPFRLYRDEGRTFLQWYGNSDLRTKLFGRLVIIHLMCREVSSKQQDPKPAISSPCIAFRIDGSPYKYISTSVFLYLHLRRKNKPGGRPAAKSAEGGNGVDLRASEEGDAVGVIKNNPLLAISPHYMHAEPIYSDTNSSDTESPPDIIRHHGDHKKHQLIDRQTTSALVHYQLQQQRERQQPGRSSLGMHRPHFSMVEASHDSTTEKLPEENTPPPAAIEFLCKIREVISIAKEKMALKRFTPSLLNIPEEEDGLALREASKMMTTVPTRPASSAGRSARRTNVNLKRENSRRRRTCGGCPGCEPQSARGRASAHGTGKLPEFSALPACQNCQIPILRNPETAPSSTVSESPRRLRSPARSLPPNHGQSSSDWLDLRAGSPRPSSERQRSASCASTSPKPKRKTRKSRQPPPPPVSAPILASKKQSQNQTRTMNLPPPDMIQEAMEVDRTEKRVALTQKQQEEIIKGLTFHQNLVVRGTEKPFLKNKLENSADYETDSLERITRKVGGLSGSTEYEGETSSPHPSPSLSAGATALPDQEEMTMRNAIFNTRTGHMTISKINVDTSSAQLRTQDQLHHDYQLIVTRRGGDATGNGPTQVANGGGKVGGGSEYSLVSEVYVNNGYNYGSAPSSPGSSPSSTMDRRALKVKYEENDNKPGKLLIEVEDCADHYIPVCESDGFEPDTLDRKPSGATATKEKTPLESKPPAEPSMNSKPEFTDPMERPGQILLRTTGSFRSDALKASKDNSDSGNFTRVFGSLRDIYEAKTKGNKQQQDPSKQGLLYSFIDGSDVDEKGRILTLEERHSKRQRAKSTFVQPDLIPPPPAPTRDSFILYDGRTPQNGTHHVTGPETVLGSLPKNGNCRSAINSGNESGVGVGLPPRPTAAPPTRGGTPARPPLAGFELCLRPAHRTTPPANARLVNAADVILTKQMDDRYVLHLCQVSMALSKRNANGTLGAGAAIKEDSGYLSGGGDSCDSKKAKRSLSRSPSISEESEESLEDGRSESGAESIETHSVFFDRITTGPGHGHGGEPDTDSSEPVSYATVVPFLMPFSLLNI